ncbi:MAG: phage holin family protein, partial [Burkholderiaceae bacterium]
LFDGLLWGGIAIVVLALGLVLLCGFVVLLFWDGHRLAAVGGMTLLFLVGGGLMLNHARARLQNRSSSKGMFDASLAELKRDQSDLTSASQDIPR